VNEKPKQHRIRAAQAAKDYLERKISWDDFMNEFGESEDEAVAELVDIIEHEPYGLVLARYEERVTQAIKALCE
jgi:hypothetical protein